MASENGAQMTEMAHASMPFAKQLGVEITTATPDEVEAVVQWAPDRCTAGDILHGGYLMAVADSVGALTAYLNLPEGATTATVDSNTSFFRAVRKQDVTFRSHPVHVGRTVIVVQTDGVRADGALATRTTQTQAVTTQAADGEAASA